ncbi:hypothetical protein BDF20DRAFT_987148 [Mycotypha africana]|uniref:uncharacterized protein n=1 Tax=Mycotypha africana TaxID=64632 RepID=UPI00230098FC|nr:uncharacterized protein BDF20DRAFT_987148 [Mycotypha africana]KAI8982208.1 hypothetical protein BDF20DRAFT_987148 [Mycotypha africana]
MTNKDIKEAESIVQLALPTWTKEQRLSIARISAQALTQTAPFSGELWSREWWATILNYLKLTQPELEAHYISLNQALRQVSTEKRDIRIEILMDMLALALHITPDAMKKEAAQSKRRHIMVYDARSRQFLITLTQLLQLQQGISDLCAVERSVTQQVYYGMLEQQKKQHPGQSEAEIESTVREAVENSNKKKEALRWLATGAGILGGGAVIALTGGLAAPLLAPILVGVTGATFFATAGGVVLVTGLFGLTGGGLAGWKMHRRMKGIEDFRFQQILNDPDLPPVPALNATICISGFLLEPKDESTTPWERAFEGNRANNDVFCLNYEQDILLDLGYSFKKFVKDTAIRYAGMEVARATVLHAVFAAVALPATVMKLADVIDNPWQMAVDRSKKAGEVLADIIEQRVQGHRPCNLVAYSCGCLVIWQCLLELQKRGLYGYIDNVIMMGAPISTVSTPEEDEDISLKWAQAVSVVSGRFVNCYTPNDWVLAFVYRLHSLAMNVAGLEEVKVLGANGHNRITNIKVDIDGHTKYPYAVKEILDQVRFE